MNFNLERPILACLKTELPAVVVHAASVHNGERVLDNVGVDDGLARGGAGTMVSQRRRHDRANFTLQKQNEPRGWVTRRYHTNLTLQYVGRVYLVVWMYRTETRVYVLYRRIYMPVGHVPWLASVAAMTAPTSHWEEEET